jgi:hypothetical protein
MSTKKEAANNNNKQCNAPKIYQVLGFIFELWMPWNV